jgi:hypothetical protein
MVLRIAAGSRLSTAEKLSTTALVVALSILARTTNPVVRSTSVPTEERLPAPLDQVGLPVTRDEAILDLWRADVDALHVRDLAAAIGATAARLSYLIVVPQAGHELALKLAPGMQVDGVVDGFVGHGFFRIVGPKAPEFARNLLR